MIVLAYVMGFCDFPEEGPYHELDQLAEEYFRLMLTMVVNVQRKNKIRYWEYRTSNPFLLRLIRETIARMLRSVDVAFDQLIDVRNRFRTSYRNESVASTKRISCRYRAVLKSFISYYFQFSSTINTV